MYVCVMYVYIYILICIRCIFIYGICIYKYDISNIFVYIMYILYTSPPTGLGGGGVGHYQPQGGRGRSHMGAAYGSMQRRRHRYEYSRALPATGGEGGRSHIGAYLYIYIYTKYIFT